MESKLSQSSLPIAIFNSTSSFFPKHFDLLAQRWKFEIQRISWKSQHMRKRILVHVVKEGETLTSISKLYGVPIVEITAANEENGDIDLVFEGQRVNIPSAIAGWAQVCHFDGNKLHEHQLPKASSNLAFRGRQWNQIIAVPSFHRLSLAKTTGSFLVLIPLVALCIGCIIGAFHSIVSRNLRRRAADKSRVHQHRPNSMRWKTALSDLRDPESQDAEPEPEPDSDPLLEDEEKFHFEDVSRDYDKLEGDYQKFLSECGMSNWGYWRGGSPQ